MAVVAGTVQNVHLHETPGGYRTNGSGLQFMTCVVTATFAGTYAQSDNAQITGLNTSIQNSRRDGRTVTLVDAMMEHPGDEAGTVIGAKTVAISTNDLTAELTGSDLSTEHANAALGSFVAPIGFRVSYTLSNPS